MSNPFLYRGSWCIEYLDGQGKRKRKVLSKNKREAYRLWKAGLANGTSVASDATFAKVADEWLDLQEKRLDAGLVSGKWLQRANRTVQAFRLIHPRVKCSQVTERLLHEWLPDASQAYFRTGPMQ